VLGIYKKPFSKIVFIIFLYELLKVQKIILEVKSSNEFENVKEKYVAHRDLLEYTHKLISVAYKLQKQRFHSFSNASFWFNRTRNGTVLWCTR
jgi:hypothetical protein